MALQREVRGIGNRSKFFFAGRPTNLLAFDDAIVLLPSSIAGGLMMSFGAVGAGARAVQQLRQEKARAGAADELTAADFAEHKRAMVIPYGEIGSARLKTGRAQDKLTFETPAGERYLRYPRKLWPADEVRAFLGPHLGERFHDAAD